MELSARIVDITTLDTDAIVNAANESLACGGAYAATSIVPRAPSSRGRAPRLDGAHELADPGRLARDLDVRLSDSADPIEQGGAQRHRVPPPRAWAVRRGSRARRFRSDSPST